MRLFVWVAIKLGWACRLGWHTPIPSEMIRENDFPGCYSYTNAECGRCGKRMWVNWRGSIAYEIEQILR